MGKKYYVKSVIALLLLCVGVVWALSVKTYASTPINSNIDEFDHMGGSAAYINHQNRYHLDMEETGLVDGMGAGIVNTIANIIFTIIKWLGLVVVVLFYQCMNFDVAVMFKDQINTIQSTLHNGIFEPMFILGFCGSAVIIIKNMVRKDLMGAYGQILKVVGIVILSILIVRDSATVLSAATSITKEISTQALVGMQGRELSSTSSFAAQSAATLWDNLVHEPWVFIQFGNDEVSSDTIYEFLRYDPDKDHRKELVENHDGNAFSQERAGEKVGFMILYLIPFLVKCCVYILMALLALAFQVIAIFYVLLAPIVLVLTMMPGYDGLMNAWIRKILETQLSVLIISFLIGLLVKFDSMLYAACAGSWGWLVVLIVQAVIEALVVYKRNELLGVLSNLQKRVSPNTARAMMMMNADGFQLAERGIQAGRKIAGSGIEKRHTLAGRGISTVSAGYDGFQDSVFQEEPRETDVDNGNGASRSSSTIKRPVMTVGQETISQEPYHNTNVIHRDATMSAQKPQETVIRPRMENYADEANIVRFEACREQNVVEEGRIMGRGEVVQSEVEIARPSMSNMDYYDSNVFQEIQSEEHPVERPVMKATSGEGNTEAVQRMKKEHEPVSEEQIVTRPSLGNRTAYYDSSSFQEPQLQEHPVERPTTLDNSLPGHQGMEASKEQGNKMSVDVEQPQKATAREGKAVTTQGMKQNTKNREIHRNRTRTKLNNMSQNIQGIYTQQREAVRIPQRDNPMPETTPSRPSLSVEPGNNHVNNNASKTKELEGG